MDEIIEKIDSTEIQNTYEDLYKNKGKPGSQESRRQELLEQQKLNRNTSVDKLRGILNTSGSSDSVKWEKKPIPYRYRPALNINGAEVNYKNILMFSEWMVEKPRDFENHWFIVPSPKGTRMLVIAKDGYTSFYSKFGQFRFECSTGLPGGNLQDFNKCERCVLDGIYVEKNNTFYVLDVMVWNCQEVTYGQTEYRNFWLETNISYNPELSSLKKKNEVRFILLPKVSCEKVPLNEFLQKYPAFHENFPELDGFLFYHRYAFYTSGQTPLVGWLYSYMIPEVLGEDVKVHPKYLVKPKDYKDQATFIEQYEEKRKKKKKCKKQDMEYYCLSPQPQESFCEYMMTNKWILDKPKDLEANYFIVPIPKSIKMMAVSCSGSTRFYNKYGFLEFERQTRLPGGNQYDRPNSTDNCILDGYYEKGNNTFYILDLLGWNNFNIYGAVAAYRNYWLHQNLDVYPEIRAITDINEVIFHVLPKCGTTQAEMINFLSKYPTFEGGFPALDLLAFIQRGQMYKPGEHLEVLHPFMIPEVLGCHYLVHEEYMKAQPFGYSNRYAYVQANEENKIKEMRENILFLNKLKLKRIPQFCDDSIKYLSSIFKHMDVELEKQRPISILEDVPESNSNLPYASFVRPFSCRSHVSDEKLSEHSFDNDYYVQQLSWTNSPVFEMNDSDLMDVSNVDDEGAMTDVANATKKVDSDDENESEEETESDEEDNEVFEEAKKDKPTNLDADTSVANESENVAVTELGETLNTSGDPPLKKPKVDDDSTNE